MPPVMNFSTSPRPATEKASTINDRLHVDETASRKLRAELPAPLWAWSLSDPALPRLQGGSGSAVPYRPADGRRRWAKSWIASLAPAEKMASAMLEEAATDARGVIGHFFNTGSKPAEARSAILRLLEERGALEALVDHVWEGMQTLASSPDHATEFSTRIAKVGVPPPPPGRSAGTPGWASSDACQQRIEAARKPASDPPNTAPALKLRLSGHLDKLADCFTRWCAPGPRATSN